MVDEYINRKGRASLNVEATCDSRYWATNADISWPGTVQDVRIWNNSDVRADTTLTALLVDNTVQQEQNKLSFGIETIDSKSIFRAENDAIDRFLFSQLTFEQ